MKKNQGNEETNEEITKESEISDYVNPLFLKGNSIFRNYFKLPENVK